MADILIIDDDRELNLTLKKVIERLGHTVKNAFSLKEGIDLVYYNQFDVVILDVRLPDGNGLEALPLIQNSPSEPLVVITTAHGDQNGAELAIQNGAWDYIKKPASINEITLPLVRALEYRQQKQLQRFFALKREGIIGSSKKINRVLDLVAQAANSSANVLITGETGTGKELFARTIHQNSSRSDRNFVVVDCAALPETLVESILFGYEKGAFTGAERATGGLVDQANGGTLFLDEVGELPLAMQKAFLRVLQEHRFNPIGSKEEHMSDFRLIAATNRDLNQMVVNETFRKDFLFRINSFYLDLPSLRERREDITELILYYNRKFCNQYSIKMKGISPEFFEAMMLHDWPGNIRELVNTMERVILVAREDPILLHYHLPITIRIKMAQSSFSPTGSQTPAKANEYILDGLTAENFPSFDSFSEMSEKYYFSKLMALVGGKRNDVCRISSISRSKVYRILKKHAL